MSVSDHDLRQEVLEKISTARLLDELTRRHGRYPDSIARISAVNMERCLRWHDPMGWSPADWAVALAGETGELCNFVKKLNRLRDKLPGNVGRDEEAGHILHELEKEVADVYLYLDLFTARMGFNLYSCIRNKFNETSEKLGFPERL